MEKPSKELVEQILDGARRLTAAQVPEFVGLAAIILKNYKAQQDNNKDADVVCLFLIDLFNLYSFLFLFRK